MSADAGWLLNLADELDVWSGKGGDPAPIVRAASVGLTGKTSRHVSQQTSFLMKRLERKIGCHSCLLWKECRNGCYYLEHPNQWEEEIQNWAPLQSSDLRSHAARMPNCDSIRNRSQQLRPASRMRRASRIDSAIRSRGEAYRKVRERDTTISLLQSQLEEERMRSASLAKQLKEAQAALEQVAHAEPISGTLGRHGESPISGHVAEQFDCTAERAAEAEDEEAGERARLQSLETSRWMGLGRAGGFLGAVASGPEGVCAARAAASLPVTVEEKEEVGMERIPSSSCSDDSSVTANGASEEPWSQPAPSAALRAVIAYLRRR